MDSLLGAASRSFRFVCAPYIDFYRYAIAKKRPELKKALASLGADKKAKFAEQWVKDGGDGIALSARSSACRGVHIARVATFSVGLL